MTQEEKQLLFKDLCARLPYGIYIYHEDYCEDNPEKLDTIHYDSLLGNYGFQCCVDDMDEGYHSIEKIKPYLRPMSSMTDDEWIKMHNCCNAILMGDKRICIEKSKFGSFSELQDAYTTIDWLNAHHFDYRGLIEMGLALPAPEGMYNIK